MKRAVKVRKNAPPKSFWRQLTSPLYVFMVLVLTFGLSTVGRAAETIKKTIRSKRKNLKETYSALLASRAMAYFQPIWVADSSKDLPAPMPALGQILQDSENRIENEFDVPAKLRGRVGFWFDVYARFTSQYRIVHDKDNPELIYGYMDFRPLYRSMPGRMARARAYQIEQRVLKELKDRVAEAMEISSPAEPRLTAEESLGIKNLLAKFDIKTSEEAARPIRRIRAQSGQKDAFLKGLHRSKKLMPEIEALFKEKGLPVALARLPFVESSFNPSAFSKVGAMGMWQFMPATAKLFAPRASRRELVDPLKQSKSAVKMFTILKSKFADWGLAVTSYNSGAGRVQRIAETYRAHDIEGLLALPIERGKLGFAGTNFYCEFLAAVLVEGYQEKIFTTSEMQLARLNLSRKIQSLFDVKSAQDGRSELRPVGVVTPTPAIPINRVARDKKAVAKKAKRSTSSLASSPKKQKSNLRSLRAQNKKKTYANHSSRRGKTQDQHRARSSA